LFGRSGKFDEIGGFFHNDRYFAARADNG
jgi:hypothetical protein